MLLRGGRTVSNFPMRVPDDVEASRKGLVSSAVMRLRIIMIDMEYYGWREERGWWKRRRRSHAQVNVGFLGWGPFSQYSLSIHLSAPVTTTDNVSLSNHQPGPTLCHQEREQGTGFGVIITILRLSNGKKSFTLIHSSITTSRYVLQSIENDWRIRGCQHLKEVINHATRRRRRRRSIEVERSIHVLLMLWLD